MSVPAPAAFQLFSGEEPALDSLKVTAAMVLNALLPQEPALDGCLAT